MTYEEIHSDTYVSVHKGLIDRLRVLGIKYPYDTRLDLFWLLNEVTKVNGYYPKEDVEIAQQCMTIIDKLVYMRTKGLEPEHKDGRYIN